MKKNVLLFCSLSLVITVIGCGKRRSEPQGSETQETIAKLKLECRGEKDSWKHEVIFDNNSIAVAV